jgi:hypothetical protein
MSKGSNAVSNCGRARILTSGLRVLLRLSRKLRARKVFRFPLLLGNTMSVRRAVLQFGGSLVILVM